MQHPGRPVAPDTPKSKHKICLFNLHVPVVVRGEKHTLSGVSISSFVCAARVWLLLLVRGRERRRGEGEERRREEGEGVEEERKKRGERGGGGKGEEEGYLNTFSEHWLKLQSSCVRSTYHLVGGPRNPPEPLRKWVCCSFWQSCSIVDTEW